MAFMYPALALVMAAIFWGTALADVYQEGTMLWPSNREIILRLFCCHRKSTWLMQIYYVTWDMLEWCLLAENALLLFKEALQDSKALESWSPQLGSSTSSACSGSWRGVGCNPTGDTVVALWDSSFPSISCTSLAQSVHSLPHDISCVHCTSVWMLIGPVSYRTMDGNDFSGPIPVIFFTLWMHALLVNSSEFS